MKRENILNMVDRKIVESLVEGHAIRYIQNELNQKMNTFASKIKESDKSIDLVKLLTVEPETITPSKVKWQVMYIKGCSKRVKDLDWLIKNKHKFPGLSNSQVFNLIKLKDRLSEENALPF